MSPRGKSVTTYGGYNPEIMDGVKSADEKLSTIQSKIQQVADFLVDYLPLANAHNSDFFVHKQWDGFITPSVASELLSLSPEQLSSLPSNLYTSTGTCWTATATAAAAAGGKLKKKLMICKVHRQKSRQLKAKWDMTLRPTWRHSSLAEFVMCAQQHTLPHLGLLTDPQHIQEQFSSSSVTGEAKESVTITNFMSSKKSYEVEEMAKMCSVLAKHGTLAKVIDIGSGRGYLGCQLALMHGLQVLGIDSSTTNTSSAKTRAQRLEKHWDGLVRNAREDAQRGYKVRRGKNYRGKVRRRERSTSDSGVNSDSQESTKSNSAQVEANLEAMFRESSPSSPTSEADTGEDGRKEGEAAAGSKTPESLVIYLSEPRVRKPRPESTSRFSPAKDTDTLYRPITHYVTVDTDLHELVKSHLGEERCRLMVTGLHTCGNLTSSVLQLYIANPAVRTLCNVGCCYHLLEEEFIRNPYLEDGEPDYEEVGFPLSEHLRHQACQLGRNARMLASQATDRAATSSKLPGQSLFWRAVLQVILRDVSGGECRQDWQVGKIANKCKNFPQYVRKALAKLNMKDELSDERILEYEAEYSEHCVELQAFVQLRAVLAPCIETLLLLDRLLYLLEQDCIEEAHVLRMFDPVKSPRCYGLIATKKQDATQID